jgi:hypothetical protein
MQQARKPRHLTKPEWVLDQLLTIELSFTRVAVFGSWLASPKTCGDFDLLLVYEAPEKVGSLQIAASAVQGLKRAFQVAFELPLHVTMIEAGDPVRFERFLLRAGEIRDLKATEK